MDIFKYDFMIRALIGGSLIATLAPFIGTYIVMRRYSFLVDTLAHIAFIGAIIGFSVQVAPSIVTIVIVTFAGICIEELRMRKLFHSDSALVLFLYGSLSIAALLLHILPTSGLAIESFLFGSIVTLQTIDIWLLCIVGVLTCIVFWYKSTHMFSMIFDEEWSMTNGIHVRIYSHILIILASCIIAISVRMVGVLLVGGLMIVPTLIVKQWNVSFKKTILYSMILSFTAMHSGIFTSYYVGIPTGSVVILTLLGIAIGVQVTTFCKQLCRK